MMKQWNDSGEHKFGSAAQSHVTWQGVTKYSLSGKEHEKGHDVDSQLCICIQSLTGLSVIHVKMAYRDRPT